MLSLKPHKLHNEYEKTNLIIQTYAKWPVSKGSRGSAWSVEHFNFQYLHSCSKAEWYLCAKQRILFTNLFFRVGQGKCEVFSFVTRRPNFAKLKWSPVYKSWPWPWLFLLILDKSMFNLVASSSFNRDAWR